jgi:hypothetical protein
MELNLSLKKFVAKAVVLASFSSLPVLAQPTPAPTTGDLPCKEEANVVGTDTVVSAPDQQGYFSLFDGTFKGWFQSCLTTHTQDKNQPGGIFRLGQADGKPAIYTTQRGSANGGIMMTNKKFTNYEIVFETWPDYGNDAGLFHRTNITGNCFQTVLDYIGSASVGGTWAENWGFSRDFRPWRYNSETDISISGSGEGNWTQTTQKLKASSEPNIPCATTGCVSSDYFKLWDVDGWNMIKVQFYGGTGTTSPNVHMKSWFKKPADNVWIPIIQDTTLAKTVPAGYIGIQVHGGGRFGGAKGTWYRNIRWKPIDDKGMPTVGVGSPSPRMRDPNFKITADASVISGTIDMDYQITVKDLAGRNLETFSGKAGAVNHAFTTNGNGVLFLNIHTASGIQTARIFRTAL